LGAGKNCKKFEKSKNRKIEKIEIQKSKNPKSDVRHATAHRGPMPRGRAPQCTPARRV
jgi:hypothetical protein